MCIKKLKPFLRKVKTIIVGRASVIDMWLIRFFSLNGFLASFYYCFISPSFYREHLSGLRGRLKYSQALDEIKTSSVLLRRNTHRLEKGLIMQPRREVFARAYIGETVSCYRNCVNSENVNADEMKWAKDVLIEYFSVVAQTDKKINRARNEFEKIKSQCNDACSSLHKESKESKPYAHHDLPTTEIDFDGLVTLFQRRRSVRWYQDKSVPRDLIEQAVNAASLAPSACNRQPYRFIFLDQAPEVKQVASFAMGTAGFNHQLPCLFALVGDLSCYPKERDRHVIYIDASLACMQLMLALETLGLSSCPINWPDIESRERKISKHLNLDTHERVVMLIASGYASAQGGVAYSQKKTAELLLNAV